MAKNLQDDLNKALAGIEQRANNSTELTDEQKASIIAKAREHVQKRLAEQRDQERERNEKRFFERAVREAEKEFQIGGAHVDIVLDLAPNQPYIMLDGTTYFHGVPYEVSEAQCRTMMDIAARGWEHDNEIHGEKRRADRGRRPRNASIGPNKPTIPGLYDNRANVNTSNLPSV